MSVLDVADVAGYLLQRGLLSPRAVVDGGLRVVDASRLNRVFLVTAERERSFVVKLAGDAARRRGARGGGARAPASVNGCVTWPRTCPPSSSYDAAEGVLILESAPSARDLSDHHARGRFSCALAREAGRALARLHAIPPVALDGVPVALDATSSAQVHRPDLDTVRTLSAAAVELIRIVQGFDELCAALDELARSWREDSVIHGDIRWDNCVAWRRSDSDRWARLQLIDWELSGVGDPGLDVGAFLGEYLRAWPQSIPISDPRDPGRLLAHAGLPLRRMRPALRAFWEAYARHRGAAAAELGATLRRAMRFAAVRLLAAGARGSADARGAARERALPGVAEPQHPAPTATRQRHLLGLGASGDGRVIAYREQVATALRAVAVTSSTSYAWFGRRSRPLPARWSPRSRPMSRGNTWSTALQRELYRSFYSQGRPVPVASGRGRPGTAPIAVFVEALSRGEPRGGRLGARVAGREGGARDASGSRETGSRVRARVGGLPRDRRSPRGGDAVEPAASQGAQRRLAGLLHRAR